MRFCLGNSKYPQDVFTDAIPLLPNGKIDYKKLGETEISMENVKERRE